ncbi:hypothetical protein ACIA8C_21510 [Nocardia sp. NPDC051321]|uniref:hypothetical protein n=1 Tax=Nocardia sp. NPDC051321 TaxID=3364323 RepID=UPI003799C30F
MSRSLAELPKLQDALDTQALRKAASAPKPLRRAVVGPSHHAHLTHLLGARKDIPGITSIRPGTGRVRAVFRP